MRLPPPPRPPGTSTTRNDASRMAFMLANTPPGLRPNFDSLARQMVREGQSNRAPTDLALTLQLTWRRAQKKAMTQAEP